MSGRCTKAIGLGFSLVMLVTGTAHAQDPAMRVADAVVEDRISDRLARSASLAGSDLRVNVEGGTAVLSGVVAEEGDRERALRIARQTPRVQTVRDELRVDAAAVAARRGEPMADEALAKRIAEELSRTVLPGAEANQEWIFGWEVEGEDFEFDVDVDDGNVTLQGSVDSRADVAKVREAVRAMPGVRSVGANLYVAYPPAYPYPYAHPWWFHEPRDVGGEAEDG